MEKPRVYLARELPDALTAQLHEHVLLTTYPEADTPVPRDELLRQVKGCEGILTMLTDKVDDELFDAAGPQLRVVANMAVGVDNVDVAAARKRGIIVTNTPDVLTETTADLVFALLLATARRITEAERYLRAGQWQTWSPMLLAGQDVFGATLGIIGMGRIGQAVAKRARGFSMNVLYSNRTRNEAAERTLGVVYATLDNLLTTADFVTLLTPLTGETAGLMGEREFDLMKETAILINAGRGALVDEQALYRALASGRILGAGLDVYGQEPLPQSSPLLSLPNVVLLPHIGSATVQTRLNMGQLAVNNLLAVLAGQPPLSAV